MGKTIRKKDNPLDMFSRSPRAKYSKNTKALKKKDKNGHHKKRSKNKSKIAHGDYALVDLDPHFQNSWYNKEAHLSPERDQYMIEVFEKQLKRRGQIGRFKGRKR